MNRPWNFTSPQPNGQFSARRARNRQFPASSSSVGSNTASALFQSATMNAPGLRIAGGTDEILKNIIAERVLGLPGDIRVDKDVAFKDLPTGR